MEQTIKTLSEKIEKLNAKIENLEAEIKNLCELLNTMARKQRMDSFMKKK